MAEERSKDADTEMPGSQGEAAGHGRADATEAPAVDGVGQEAVPQGDEWKGFATALASRLDDVFGADDAPAGESASRQEVHIEERAEQSVGDQGATPARPDAARVGGAPRIGFDTEYELAVQRLGGIDPEVLVKGAATLRPKEPNWAAASDSLAPDVPQVVRMELPERETQGIQDASNVEAEGQPRAASGRRPVRWIAAGLLLLALGAAALLLTM